MENVKSVLIVGLAIIFFSLLGPSFAIHEGNVSHSTTVPAQIPQTQDNDTLVPFRLGDRSGQPENSNLTTAEEAATEEGGNVILLSQRFNEEEFSSEIVGEVENNGTEPVEFVRVTTTFYDNNGDIVTTRNSYTDPSDLRPGMKAPFTILLGTEFPEEAETYEFAIQWDNPNGSTGINTFKGEEAGESDNGGEDEDSEDGNGEDDDEENDEGTN